jgi:molecular chaperone DnaK (HSP70)
VKLARVYNESTATVMNYGMFRKSDLSDEKPRLVSFVDLGFSKTTLFFANIWKNKAEILYEKTDKNLGVRDLDNTLLKHYTANF